MENYFSNDKFDNIELKNINREMLGWLENVVVENNGRIERKEWKSKYNSYVIYDYEPFCTDGFEINMQISSFDPVYLNFINYLYNEKKNTIDYLNNCVEKSAYAVRRD